MTDGRAGALIWIIYGDFAAGADFRPICGLEGVDESGPLRISSGPREAGFPAFRDPGAICGIFTAPSL